MPTRPPDPSPSCPDPCSRPPPGNPARRKPASFAKNSIPSAPGWCCGPPKGLACRSADASRCHGVQDLPNSFFAVHEVDDRPRDCDPCRPQNRASEYARSRRKIFVRAVQWVAWMACLLQAAPDMKGSLIHHEDDKHCHKHHRGHAVIVEGAPVVFNPKS